MSANFVVIVLEALRTGVSKIARKSAQGVHGGGGLNTGHRGAELVS